MRYLLLLLFMLIGLSGSTQNIKAGLIFGFNATQVDGDGVAGYHKLGWNFGTTAFIPLEERFSISIELLYAQKGSRSVVDRYNPGNYYLLRLSYADVPILFNFHDKGKVIFGGGISIGTLVGFKEEIDGVENVFEDTPYFTRDYNIIANGTFLATQRFGVNIRFAYSIVPIGTGVPYPGGGSTPPNSQFSNIVTFRLIYFLNDMMRQADLK